MLPPQAVVAASGLASGQSLPSYDTTPAAVDKTTPETTGTWTPDTQTFQGLPQFQTVEHDKASPTPQAVLTPPSGTPIVFPNPAGATAPYTPPAPAAPTNSVAATVASSTAPLGQRAWPEPPGGRTVTSISAPMPQMRPQPQPAVSPGAAAASALAASNT